MTSRLAAQPGLAAEHLFQNGGSRVGLLWGQISWDRRILEAKTPVSNLTQYKLFIGDDKKKRCFLE